MISKLTAKNLLILLTLMLSGGIFWNLRQTWMSLAVGENTIRQIETGTGSNFLNPKGEDGNHPLISSSNQHHDSRKLVLSDAVNNASTQGALIEQKKKVLQSADQVVALNPSLSHEQAANQQKGGVVRHDPRLLVSNPVTESQPGQRADTNLHHQPDPVIPMAYALQSALNDPMASVQAAEIIQDPGSQDQLQQIANDFVQRINLSKDSPYSANYAQHYSQSVELADLQFYAIYGQEAYVAMDAARAAAAGQ